VSKSVIKDSLLAMTLGVSPILFVFEFVTGFLGFDTYTGYALEEIVNQKKQK
jgi:hypothetical protein